MVGRVAVAEKPELLWDRPDLEGLYIRLEDEFEIKERHDDARAASSISIGRVVADADAAPGRRATRCAWSS